MSVTCQAPSATSDKNMNIKESMEFPNINSAKEESDKRKWKINLSLLPIKVHYFVFMAALSAVLPFRTIFAKQLGISATAVGVIFTAVPFFKILTNPFFGALLDYFKKFHLIISIIMFIMATSHLGMIFIPPMHSEHPIISKGVNLSCNPILHEEKQENSLLENKQYPNCFTLKYVEECPLQCEVCSNHLTDNFFSASSPPNPSLFPMKCEVGSIYSLHFNLRLISKEHLAVTHLGVSNVTITRPKSAPEHLSRSDSTACPCNGDLSCFSTTLSSEVLTCHEREDSTKYSVDRGIFLSLQFWWLLVLTALSSATFSAVMFIVDAVCYENLQGSPEKYGEQRLWGTMGWGVGALLGGYMNQLASVNSTEIDFSPGFYLLVALSIFDLIPLWSIKFPMIRYSPNIFKDVSVLFRKPSFSANIIMMYFVGILSGLIWNYQYWFLEELGASQLLLGLSQTFECFFAEVPCFIFAGKIFKRLGHVNCVSLTLACFAMRYLCFAYMQNPWLALPVGLLHGPTFGIFYTSMTMYAKLEAAPGTEATVQSLMSVAFEGIGCATGSIVGGIGIDTFGSKMTFIYAGICSMCLLLINIFVQFLFRRWNPFSSIRQKKVILMNSTATA